MTLINFSLSTKKNLIAILQSNNCITALKKPIIIHYSTLNPNSSILITLSFLWNYRLIPDLPINSYQSLIHSKLSINYHKLEFLINIQEVPQLIDHFVMLAALRTMKIFRIAKNQVPNYQFVPVHHKSKQPTDPDGWFSKISTHTLQVDR